MPVGRGSSSPVKTSAQYIGSRLQQEGNIPIRRRHEVTIKARRHVAVVFPEAGQLPVAHQPGETVQARTQTAGFYGVQSQMREVVWRAYVLDGGLGRVA